MIKKLTIILLSLSLILTNTLANLTSLQVATKTKSNLLHGQATNLGFEFIGDTSMLKELYEKNEYFTEGALGKVALHEPTVQLNYTYFL